jgi:hypothetical protein
MGIKELFLRSPLANYGKAIRSAPREVIFNHDVILSAMLFATSAIPASKHHQNINPRDIGKWIIC